MGDNLFAGLNMDFNFADQLAVAQPTQLQPSMGPPPPTSRGHKRHKSNPDVLNQFALAPPPSVPMSAAAVPTSPFQEHHHSMPLPDPVPFSVHGNADMANTRGLSFIEDIDMEDILKDFLQGPETPLVPSQEPNVSQLFHAKQVQESVLDMKRKSRHERHQSNPDGLLHHAQQLRMMHQQQQQLQQQQPPPQPSMPGSPSFSALLKMEMPPMSPAELLPPASAAASSRRKKKERNESTGLSMDMTQISLDLKAEKDSESNRKSYKCGRCGQPKVGHVCTLPDLRNNWSQVDLAITRGMKEIDINCKVIASRQYTVAHPDHVDHFFGT
ncbi:Aste57867_16944 [Aphanomyces stellatus]|uniref:Aste57867_16944 protein n=1 Tax=Aphanomyces stellatus TaxID=120398 RepID=A0A485L860_9STRA|nr:hypothetical protein As57867_016886 [Aphanomyces stellatus]VFT93706.1 Aste57867_16944 [Aphanomyces stellatus]